MVILTINYKKCPKCGSENVIPIAYGMPGPELFKKAEAGKVKLGGCCIEENSPEYYCNDCVYEWNKKEVIDNEYSKINGIKASVGGFSRGYNKVTIDLTGLNVEWIIYGGGMEEVTHQKSIDVQAAESFIDQLKSVKLLNWKQKYESPGILDGTQWEVEIIREGRNNVKSGDNAFPDHWDAFCSIISEIVGREFE